MASFYWWFALVTFTALIRLDLHVSPYTKVEESFNIQASHDIRSYDIPWSNASQRLGALYDHMTFPGAVPRTFVGAVVLAGLSKPFDGDGFTGQILVRKVLGTLNALSLVYYTHRAGKAFGAGAAWWYILLQASQFHIIYYASRPLPNMLAFGLTTTALSQFLLNVRPPRISHGRLRLAVYLLMISAVVFRSEVAILLFCHVAYVLFHSVGGNRRFDHTVTLLKRAIIPAGLFGGLVGFALTIPIDTFFWQSDGYLWPEMSAFLFNMFPTDDSGGASAWGTSPWNWYFINALPRILMNPLLYVALWVVGLSIPATWQPTLDLLVPNLAYIGLYSFVPHKETRFIFSVVPPLTLAGALSCSYIWTRRHRKLQYRIMSIAIVLSIALSAAISHAILLPLSSLSYPGAHALNALHQLSLQHHNSSSSNIRVHLDNLSTQTGITRFLQHPFGNKKANISYIYDKSDRSDPLTQYTYYDYIITEQELSPASLEAWDLIATIHGTGPIRLLRPSERRQGCGSSIGNRDDPDQKSSVDLSSDWDYWTNGLDAVVAATYHTPLSIDVNTNTTTTPLSRPRPFFLNAGKLSQALRHILREGHGVQWLLRDKSSNTTKCPRWSWTLGWWLDMAWTPKLYVLRRRGDGGDGGRGKWGRQG